MMTELLSGRTHMAVAQAVEGMRIEPDHLYLIPTGMLMSLVEGVLHLEPAPAGQALRLPFDHFLRSMAVDLGARAVVVVLTGTGADGSAALAAIREGGGVVFVQDPDEAAFDGIGLQQDEGAIRHGAAGYLRHRATPPVPPTR